MTGLDSPPPLIYLHIPKCGGTTLNWILKRNFAPDRRFLVGRDIAASRRELAALPEPRRMEIDLLHGHLSYGWHAHLPRPARYFTIIRDPVARVVSHYNFVRFRTDKDHYLRPVIEREGMTLREYVESGVCDEVNNGQVRLLSGVEDIVQEPYGASKIPYGTNDTALLDRALDNIEQDFAVVGLQDAFDESVLLLKSRLGLAKSAYEARNIGRRRYTKVRPTAEEVRIIERYNRLDIALYERMKERFRRDLENLSLIGMRTRLFRLGNRVYRRARSVHRALRSGASTE